MDSQYERLVRDQAMAWLDGRAGETVDYTWLTTFEMDGVRLPLIDRQRGIRKPAALSAALAIRTTFTAPDQAPPYADAIGLDGLQRYKYRGSDPQHPENVALRRAFQEGLPLIWFIGIAKGKYEPIYPVWIVGDDPGNLEFTLAVEQGQRFLKPEHMDDDARKYALRMTKARLHQPVFRAQVLQAYQGKCCICRLKHTELLDAAHIIGDGQPNGQPIVPNGLSLCKIHHAAYDHNILGIRPDLTIHIREDVLEEVDGWMLKGGIQGVHNKPLEVVPGRQSERPDPTRVEERYTTFLSA